jgi:hypothetical protein
VMILHRISSFKNWGHSRTVLDLRIRTEGRAIFWVSGLKQVNQQYLSKFIDWADVRVLQMSSLMTDAYGGRWIEGKERPRKSHPEQIKSSMDNVRRDMKTNKISNWAEWSKDIYEIWDTGPGRRKDLGFKRRWSAEVNRDQHERMDTWWVISWACLISLSCRICGEIVTFEEIESVHRALQYYIAAGWERRDITSTHIYNCTILKRDQIYSTWDCDWFVNVVPTFSGNCADIIKYADIIEYLSVV